MRDCYIDESGCVRKILEPKSEDLKTILKHYGEPHQLGKLKEECMELIDAIDSFVKNNNIRTADHLLEEMADVKVVIDEFRTVDAYDSIIRGIAVYKVNRQLERIEQGKKMTCKDGVCYVE